MNRSKRRGCQNKVSTVHHLVTEEETETESEVSPKIRKTSHVKGHKKPLTVEQEATATKPDDPCSKKKKTTVEVKTKPMISVCDIHENADGNELETAATVDREESAINSIKTPRDEARIQENYIKKSKQQFRRPPTETLEDSTKILPSPMTKSSDKNPKPSGSACNKNSSNRVAQPQRRPQVIEPEYCDAIIPEFLYNLNCQLRETGRDEVLMTDFLSCFMKPSESLGKPATESDEGKPSDSARNENSSNGTAQLETHETESGNSYFEIDPISFYYNLNSQLYKTGKAAVLLTDILSCLSKPNEKDIVRLMSGPEKPSTI